jgi:MoaA/NifB/PqqE/SkfB family radical SAM enzyme
VDRAILRYVKKAEYPSLLKWLRKYRKEIPKSRLIYYGKKIISYYEKKAPGQLPAVCSLLNNITGSYVFTQEAMNHLFKEGRYYELLKELKGLTRIQKQIVKSSRIKLYYRLTKNLRDDLIRRILKNLIYNETDIFSCNFRITSKCNLNCNVCDIPSIKRKRDMPYKKIISTLTQLKRLNLRILRINGGEPTLHPKLNEIIRQAKSLGFYIELKTNGTTLSPAQVKQLFLLGLDTVTISVDSTTDSSYRRTRRSDGIVARQKVLLDTISKLGQMHKVKINTTISQYNIHELGKILDICIQYKIKYITYSLPDTRKDNSVLLSKKNITLLYAKTLPELQTRAAGHNIIIRTNPPVLRSNKNVLQDYSLGDYGSHFYGNHNHPCNLPLYNLEINYDGDLYYCCNTLFHKTNKVGNIHTTTIAKALASKKALIIRQSLIFGCDGTCCTCKDNMYINEHIESHLKSVGINLGDLLVPSKFKTNPGKSKLQ